MATQGTLPLQLDPLPAFAGVASVRPGGVETRMLPAREVLNRRGRAWTVNPYRGCELGCLYCYGRSSHELLGWAGGDDFERRIFVKQGAARALERRLRKSARPGQRIVVGTVTDPYQPVERRHRVTRELLETFDRFEGLTLAVATRSPLVLRDIELLARLNRKHAVEVRIAVATVESDLATRLEPGSPAPAERLRAAAEIAGRGVPVAIDCMPLLTGVNAGSRQLLPLFDAAESVGAFDLETEPLVLRTPVRARFWRWLRREYPHLEPRYRRLYRSRSTLSRRDAERVTSIFRRLKLERGFPR
ncbi:MAG: radical SAM protein [Thermoanaerobaculia bacterium]|nr:radical SAM protein [Thermoanaerobaculia bacterium]